MIEVLHRGRFWVIESAVVERISTNAWTVKVPTKDPIHRRVRREPTAEGWDGAVFFLDDKETEPGVGTAVRAGFVEISAFAL